MIRINTINRNQINTINQPIELSRAFDRADLSPELQIQTGRHRQVGTTGTDRLQTGRHRQVGTDR